MELHEPRDYLCRPRNKAAKGTRMATARAVRRNPAAGRSRGLRSALSGNSLVAGAEALKI